jgi:HPt (histidine-containing phosphotransfer) domain-containing protein
LLQRFARDYAGFGGRVDAHLAASRWDDATREAHTLKGLAGSLGAMEVQPLAATLERAARARDAGAAGDALRRVEASLTPLLATLRARFAVDDRPDEPREDAGPSERAPADSVPVERAASAAGSGEHGPAGAVSSERADAAVLSSSEWLHELRRLLQEGDVEALDYWAARPAEIAANLPVDAIRRLSVALDSYDYDAALSLLAGSVSEQTPG